MFHKVKILLLQICTTSKFFFTLSGNNSMDNSVPTLEDQSAKEIVMDQEAPGAYMPRGDNKQSMGRQPPSKTISERGDYSDTLPIESEEINPKNAGLNNKQPESSPHTLGKSPLILNFGLVYNLIFEEKNKRIDIECCWLCWIKSQVCLCL